MTIPNNLRIPIFAAEFDSSHAFQGPSLLQYKAIIFGQKLSSGTKAANVPVLVSSSDQANQFFGIGSMLAIMFGMWFQNNKTTPVYGMPLSDDGGATKATGTIAMTGPATAAGTIYLYISGKRLTIAVSNTDTATVIGAAIAAAINAATYLPVTATATTGTVTITAQNGGPNGNDIDIHLNYNEGETLPAGTGATVTPMASGATAPALATAITAMADNWFNVLVGPYNDATSLTAIETELADRAGPIRMIDGIYVTSKVGNLSTLATFGNGRNSAYVSCIDGNKVPNTPWELASSYAGQLAAEGSSDPARPFQTVPMFGILPPAIVDRRPVLDNNTLLFDGISTFTVDQGGVVRIQRAITMYQKNGAGAADIAYLDVTTILTLMYLRFDFRTQFQTTYPRAKLADDGAVIPPGQVIVTPKIAKAKAISIFRGWMLLGLTENIDQFKRDLVVVRDTDPSRLNFTLPPDLVNGFIVGAAEIQFLLQSPVGF